MVGTRTARDERAAENPGVAALDVAALEIRGGHRRDELTGVLKTVAAVAPPVTVATALLFYFGWARTDAQARYLGFDESVLGLSTQDYLMHSISSLFLPAAVLAVGGLLWIAIDARATSFVLERTSRRWVRIMLGVLAVSWALLPLSAMLVARAWPGSRDIGVPLSLTIGLLLAVSAQSQRRLLVRNSGLADRRKHAPVWHASARRTCIGILIVLSLFWTVANYAQIVGRGLGERVISHLDARPGVLVYSPKRLQIDAPGVDVTRFDADDAAYQFCYSGLRLLQRSNGRYFLIPRGWTETNGTIIVVPDSEPIRVEFVRSTVE